MDTERIAETAALLSGRERDERLELLCVGAAEELKGLLRPDVTAEECGEAFTVAAAWLALDGLDRADAGEVVAFTAGDVSVKKGDKGKDLRSGALRLMKPWLRDEGFIFRGVRG